MLQARFRRSVFPARLWLLCLGALIGCAHDIPCREGNVGAGCDCPTGSKAEGERCVSSTGAGGDGGLGTDAPDGIVRDAGSVTRSDDASSAPGPSAPPGRTETPAPAADASAPAGADDAGMSRGSRAEQCLSSCPAGRCDSDGRCVPLPATCGNRIQEAGEECDDGNNNSYDTCVGCKNMRCGDGFVQRENQEECEDGASSPGFSRTQELLSVGVWTADNCSFQTCRRKIYTLCDSDAQCPVGSSCLVGVCAPMTCYRGSLATQLEERAAGTPLPPCMLPACPRLPGFPEAIVYLTSCMIECNPDPPHCPVGLTCKQAHPSEDKLMICVSAEGKPLF